MAVLDEGGQTNASDTEQVAWAKDREDRREKRRAFLWRQLMDSQEGREWLFEVLLADLGYLRSLQGPVEEMYSRAALHNLCCRYVAMDIARHHDLYRQMQLEAIKREDQERSELAAARAKWRAREGEPDGD